MHGLDAGRDMRPRKVVRLVIYLSRLEAAFFLDHAMQIP